MTGQHIDTHDLERMHDEMLDECCEPVRIGSLTYDPSQVLKSVDPIAYRESMHNYADCLCKDGHTVEGYNDDE